MRILKINKLKLTILRASCMAMWSLNKGVKMTRRKINLNY
jgi:hypothetical protein